MKRHLILCFFISLLSISCVRSQECIEGTNKLPMYGKIKKCKELLEDDRIFLADCDKTFSNRKEAAAHMIMRGWQYFYNKKLDTAMMRFNQAWLLDSLNSEVYWGFGNILGVQHKFKESLPFFEKSLKINPDNAKVWEDLSTSYGNVFFETKDKIFLNSSIYTLKRAIKLDPRNPRLYGQLTSVYCYFVQKDSAKKYLKITEQMDPSAINPEVRKFLNANN